MPRVISAFKQFLDGEGNPLISGWLKFTVSGTNNTDKATYADSAEEIPNTNPLQLDAEGRCPDVFGTGSYRVVSYTNDTVGNIPAVQIQQKDPVPGGADGSGEWSIWNSTSSYEQGAIRVGDDGKYYRSLENGNEGNPPPDTQFWEEIKLVSVYVSARGYVAGEIILFTDLVQYTCLVDTAPGETPITNSAKWSSIAIGSVFDDKSPELGADLDGLGFKISNTNIGTTVSGSVALDQDLDLSTGNILQFAPSTDISVTFSNIPANGANVWFVEMTGAGDYTTTWPTAVKWDGDAEPTWASGTDTSVAQFYTRDGGTTILGRILWEAVI